MLKPSWFVGYTVYHLKRSAVKLSFNIDATNVSYIDDAIVQYSTCKVQINYYT